MNEDAIIDAPASPPLLDDPAALAGALGAGDPMGLLMAQLGASNPQAAMLMRVLEERKRAHDAEQAEELSEAAAEAAAAREQDFIELKDTMERALADLEALRARLDDLADALGACPSCFGSDPLCGQCHGRGRPGGRAPDPAAFRSYVLPAVRRARAIDLTRRQRAHHTDQPPQHPSQQTAPMSQPGIQP